MVVAIASSIGAAIACFTIVALLPRPDGPLFKEPLRSLLTGLGVLGVACPLCIAGHVLKKRSAGSPYFEGAFIATVLGLFGLVCLGVGLVCIGFGIYDLVVQYLVAG